MGVTPLSKNREKLIRKLHAKKYRHEQGLFLAEGINALTEACKGTHYPIREVILCDDIIIEKDDKNIFNLPLPPGLPVYSCSRRTMATLSTEENPQGILLVCSGTPFSFAELAHHPSETLVYLDGVSDPGNLGTLFRTALWFGITQFLMGPDCVDPFNTKAIRATAGALFGIEIYCPVNINELRKFSQDYGYSMTATIPRGGTAIDRWTQKEKQIILFGHEARGLSPDLIEDADYHISIPGAGMAESLNLAAAASIIFYEATRAWRNRTNNS